MSHFAASFDAVIWGTEMIEPIISDPIEIRHEAAALGLSAEGLISCVRYADSERGFVTENDAIGFGSYVTYDKAGRALREIFLSTGKWTRDDSYNQCAIKNAETKIRVVPCNFDEFAGNRLATPSNRSPKGEISRKKSMCNLTAWLPGMVPEGPTMIDVEGYQTWLLGICAVEGLKLGAELSLPIAFKGHYFTKFGKRIMLISDGDDAIVERKEKGDGEVGVVDIEVRRKA